MSLFDFDDYPGNIKILFVGLGQSSHTHSWIKLLDDSKINVRLFSTLSGLPKSSDFQVRSYQLIPQLYDDQEQIYRQSLYVGSDKYVELLKRSPLFFLIRLLRKAYSKIAPLFGFPDMNFGDPPTSFSQALPFGINDKSIKKVQPHYFVSNTKNNQRPDSLEEWIAEIINTWQPDIIHTLGMDHDQGGFFFNEVRKKFKLVKNWKWVVQTRGGSDLELNRFNPDKVTLIKEVFDACDYIISDNTVNIEYAVEMGIAREKFSSMTPVPGTGGIDIDSFGSTNQIKPSERERVILWPKAYDCEWSLALPVFEALKLCWDQIKPCKIYMLAMSTASTRDWSRSLPSEILQNCIIRERIPRQEVFSLMEKARVLLIPSLVDGIPNSLYEAMAFGTMPIVSPLNTIRSFVSEPENVLFARNLYPDEISQALIQAMNDDELIDQTAVNNIVRVRDIADRDKIKKSLIHFYESLLD